LTSVNQRWPSQPMLFDLDDAKKQFLHFYPLLTFNIEAPFAIKVKVINGNSAFALCFAAYYYSHPALDLVI
jgi:ABC-type sulfate transport system substrate-binding protein